MHLHFFCEWYKTNLKINDTKIDYDIMFRFLSVKSKQLIIHFLNIKLEKVHLLFVFEVIKIQNDALNGFLPKILNSSIWYFCKYSTLKATIFDWIQPIFD